MLNIFRQFFSEKVLLDQDNISGPFYDAYGRTVFEDEPRAGGTETLVVDVDDDNTSTMYVNNVGKMYKTPR